MSNEQSHSILPSALDQSNDQLNNNISPQFYKSIKGVPVPEHLKEKFGIKDPPPEFVPVDPADELLARVAKMNGVR